MEKFKKAHLRMIVPTIFGQIAVLAIAYFAVSPSERMKLSNYMVIFSTQFGLVVWMLAVHFILPAVVKKQERVK